MLFLYVLLVFLLKKYLFTSFVSINIVILDHLYFGNVTLERLKNSLFDDFLYVVRDIKYVYIYKVYIVW